MTWSVATPTCVAPVGEQLQRRRQRRRVAAASGAGVGMAGRQPEVLPEQLVRAVDEVDLIIALILAPRVVRGQRAAERGSDGSTAPPHASSS